ncbi:epoxide hydrolase, soluble (sEH) [Trifolium repens]|nr:epoxide hydrolase, soluble (sEH) [Trifolium repens]
MEWSDYDSLISTAFGIIKLHLSVDRVALLSGHYGAVWQMQWDMSGMTLATTGNNGMVRLRQSNLNGVWHHQAAS